VTSRIVATQFAFQPQCIVVPANRLVTLRFAAPDVIHGILVTGTNVNTMVVPGYVSQVHTVFTKTGDLLMPCHEFCGLGHSEMSATVRVVSENEFKPDREGKAGCDLH
jgi:cytochrome c oxidase subunit 2